MRKIIYSVKIDIMKRTILILIISLCSIAVGMSQKTIADSYSKEQKVYELSMIWKEMSYNFDNMNNCPGLDMDSLYFSYIPKIQETTNDFYCYIKHNRYFMSLSDQLIPTENPIRERFGGKIYVLTGYETGSAAEHLIMMLKQNPDIVFLGHKTAGCTGRPYILSLPSGISVMINTMRTFDIDGNETSQGINPDQTIDFYDCYRTEREDVLFDCIFEKINARKE